jgi:hypothetical protein
MYHIYPKTQVSEILQFTQIYHIYIYIIQNKNTAPAATLRGLPCASGASLALTLYDATQNLTLTQDARNRETRGKKWVVVFREKW